MIPDKLKQRATVELEKLDLEMALRKRKKSFLREPGSSRTSKQMKNYSNTPRIHNCKKCCAIFKKLSHLSDHVGKVHTSSEQTCEHCSGTFNTTRNLKIHTDIYHKKSDDSSKSKSSALGRAKKIYREKNIPCPECPIRFTTVNHLTSHISTKHKGLDVKHDFVCGICPNKAYITEAQLNSHLVKHHLVYTLEKSHECKECGMKFLKKNDLTNHTTVHTGIRAFICEICGYSTKRTQELSRHKKLRHSSDRQHTCPTCGKAFAFGWQLSVHAKNHEDVKQYKCTQPGCLKTFRFSNNLRQHLAVHEVS